MQVSVTKAKAELKQLHAIREKSQAVLDNIEFFQWVINQAKKGMR